MLTPKRVKWRKVQRGRMTGSARRRGNTLTFGEFGLQALEPCWMTNRQIEAARIAMTRHIKRGGKVWIKVFPDKPVTKKPAEVRMGSGKGNPEFWVAVVRPGRVLFELSGVDGASRAKRCDSRLPSCRSERRSLRAREEAERMKQRSSCNDAARPDRSPELADRRPARPRKSCSTCASRCAPVIFRISARSSEMRRTYAQIQTVITEKRIAEDKHGAA